jgi:hypothetical protein
VWTTQYDDYALRPASLRALSPYVFTMWFQTQRRVDKRKRHDDDDDEAEAGGGDIPSARGRLAFQAGHPRKRTHELVPRQRSVVPQLLADAPVRPANPPGAPAEEHERYAAFIGALLVADWDWRARRAAAGGSDWHALVAWEIALTVAKRLETVAAARRRIRRTAREYDLSGGGADAAGGVTRNDPDGDYNSGNETDDELPQPMTDMPLDDDIIDDSVRALLAAPTDADGDHYVTAMLGPLADPAAGALDNRAPAGPEVVTPTRAQESAVRASVKAALAAAKEFDGYALHAEHVAAAARDLNTPETHARLLAVARGQAALHPGEAIPYVKLPAADRPTVAETARLWSLDAKQAIAFGLMVARLEDELADRTAREPLRLLITGKAGTGKSRILQAFQWYSLQVDAVKLSAVTAYTWRAALLLGTPDNPACTTSTFFAIDSWGKRKAGEHTLRGAGKVGAGRREHRLARVPSSGGVPFDTPC